MTKDSYEKHKKEGGWAPKWSRLPPLNGAKDLHLYWGMEPTGGFAP